VSLVGRLSVPGAAVPPGPIPLDAVLRAARAERTLPAVCRNLGRPCGEETAILGRQVLARAQADELAARVDLVRLKGVDLGHRVYPSPALRDLGDVDLLVRRSDVAAADEALRALGYAAGADPRRVLAAGGRLLNAVLYEREASLPVHLHWHLSNGSLPRTGQSIDLDEVWREARDGALAPAPRVVSLAEHALKHSFDSLLHLADLELCWRTVDRERAVDVARRWGLERALAWSLLLVRELLEVPVDVPRSPAPGWAGRLLLSRARRRRPGGSWLGYLECADGWAAKAGFVREALDPGEGGEGLSTRSFAGRVWRALTSRPGPLPGH
jgi:hypothetical protein